MFDTSDEAIAQRLQELSGLETVSPFSREFLALAAQVAAQIGAAQAVRLALAGLLDVELRYHRELQDLAAAEQYEQPRLRAAAEKRRQGLQTVAEFATGLPPGEPLAAAVRSLLLAETYYHLGRTSDVVGALEEAVALGVDQPLVQFGLGYNRYVLAVEACTRPAETEGELQVHDRLGFQLRCLRAVGALEDGLRGEEFDGQLYWWMATILEAAGLTEAARGAYDKSAEVLAGLDQQQPAVACEQCEADSDEGDEAPEAITDEELRIVGELLKGRFDPTDLRGDEPDDCS